MSWRNGKYTLGGGNSIGKHNNNDTIHRLKHYGNLKNTQKNTQRKDLLRGTRNMAIESVSEST